MVHVTIGPMAMETGDIIAVLFGSSVPFIFCPIGEHYQILGECYVHVIADGLAVKEWKESGEPAKEFHIYSTSGATSISNSTQRTLYAR